MKKVLFSVVIISCLLVAGLSFGEPGVNEDGFYVAYLEGGGGLWFGANPTVYVMVEVNRAPGGGFLGTIYSYHDLLNPPEYWADGISSGNWADYGNRSGPTEQDVLNNFQTWVTNVRQYTFIEWEEATPSSPETNNPQGFFQQLGSMVMAICLLAIAAGLGVFIFKNGIGVGKQVWERITSNYFTFK